jgi:DeoR/GlpR family transcriptional regulator of sugar metabolism
MLPDQRRKKLLEVLGLVGGADVTELSSTLAVSPATVRRDLQYLEMQGFLRRTHGGAVLPFESTAFYPHYENKMHVNQEAKVAIARAAARKVVDGDVVVLDSGTTTLLLAKELRRKRDLTIVTTDLKIALDLTDVPGFEVICVGGTVRPRSYNTLGTFAEQMLRELHANHAFLGADGIDLHAGVTNATVTEVPVKRLMMRSGRVATVLADHAKFGRVGLAKVADLTEFDEVITDGDLSPKTIDAYRASGARIAIAVDGAEPS